MELEQNYSGLSGPRPSNTNDPSTKLSHARNAEANRNDANRNTDRATDDEPAVQSGQRPKDFKNYVNQNLDKDAVTEKDDTLSGSIKNADIDMAALPAPVALPIPQPVLALTISVPDNNILAHDGTANSVISPIGLTTALNSGETIQNKSEPLLSGIVPGSAPVSAKTGASIPDNKDSETSEITLPGIAADLKITPPSGLQGELTSAKQAMTADAGVDAGAQVSETQQKEIPVAVSPVVARNTTGAELPLVEAPVISKNTYTPDNSHETRDITAASTDQISPNPTISVPANARIKTPVKGDEGAAIPLKLQVSNNDAPVSLTLPGMPPENDLITGTDPKAAPEGTTLTQVSPQPGTTATTPINPLLPNGNKLTAETNEQANKPLVQPSDRFSGRRSHEFTAGATSPAPQSAAPVAQNNSNAGGQQAQPDGQSFIQTLTQNPGGLTVTTPEVKGQEAGVDTPPVQTVNVIYLDKTGAPQADAITPPVHSEGRTHPVSPPIREIAMHISQHADNGANRFQLRLDPPELGRVDVRLEISSEGKLSAIIAVERPETLDLLQRDSRLLERSLLEAGLKTDGNSLSFSLKGGRQDNSQPGFTDPRCAGQGLAPLDDWDEPLTPLNARFANRAINIRI